MKLKRGYQYIFYLLYKLVEEYSIPKFWSDWKAVVLMDVLCVFFIFPLFLYYSIITGLPAFPDNKWIIGLFFLFLVCVPNYYMFNYRSRWKSIVKSFDNIPSGRKIINKLIGWTVVVLVTVHMVFSFFMLDLKARRNHTGPYSKEYLEQKRW